MDTGKINTFPDFRVKINSSIGILTMLTFLGSGGGKDKLERKIEFHNITSKIKLHTIWNTCKSMWTSTQCPWCGVWDVTKKNNEAISNIISSLFRGDHQISLLFQLFDTKTRLAERHNLHNGRCWKDSGKAKERPVMWPPEMKATGKVVLPCLKFYFILQIVAVWLKKAPHRHVFEQWHYFR